MSEPSRFMAFSNIISETVGSAVHILIDLVESSQIDEPRSYIARSGN